MPRGYYRGRLICKAKRQYLLTCKVSRYCLLALHGPECPLDLKFALTFTACLTGRGLASGAWEHRCPHHRGNYPCVSHRGHGERLPGRSFWDHTGVSQRKRFPGGYLDRSP